MLKKLLNQFYFEDYVPQPRHMIYPVLMIAVGYKSVLDYKWQDFGITLVLLGIALALVIIIGIAWRGPIEYWRQIENTITVMLRIKSPEIWQSMGYKEIPKMVQVIEKRVDEHGVYSGQSLKSIPVSPAVMNTLSNKVLMSKSTDFKEDDYKNIVKNFRMVKKEFKDKGYIVKKSTHPKSTYVFTKKGLSLIYEYADPAIKLQIEKEAKNG